MVGPGVGPAEVGHTHHPLFSLDCRGHGFEAGDIGVVHADDEVETVEIIGFHRARMMGEVIAALEGMDAHTSVGEFAGVAGVKTGGIDFKFVGDTPLFYNVAENPLGSRGAADIAEAYKQYTHIVIFGAEMVDRGHVNKF